jgi:hypothetical protein
MSGARSSIRRFRRLLRLMTRRYRSFRSDVAKRPPSSGTSGRSSGGRTGTMSRIIHSGRVPDSNERFDQLQALDEFLALGFRCGLAQIFFALTFSASRSIAERIFFSASAPIDGFEIAFAVFILRGVVFFFVQKLQRLERVMPGSITTNFRSRERAPAPSASCP